VHVTFSGTNCVIFKADGERGRMWGYFNLFDCKTEGLEGYTFNCDVLNNAHRKKLKNCMTRCCEKVEI
jgi:hypothetical protein